MDNDLIDMHSQQVEAFCAGTLVLKTEQKLSVEEDFFNFLCAVNKSGAGRLEAIATPNNDKCFVSEDLIGYAQQKM